MLSLSQRTFPGLVRSVLGAQKRFFGFKLNPADLSDKFSPLVDQTLGLGALAEEAKLAHPDQKVISLTAGVVMNDSNRVHVPCVRGHAEDLVRSLEVESDVMEGYGDMLGDKAARESVISRLLGKPLGPNQRYYMSGGGTHAIYMFGKFLADAGGKNIYIPTPFWGNYSLILKEAGLPVVKVPLDLTGGDVWSKFIENVKLLPANSIVLIPIGPHNPTGTCPTFEQYQSLFSIPHVIFAGDAPYLNYAPKPDELLKVVRFGLASKALAFVATSNSKDLGFYGRDRVGGLLLNMGDELTAELAENRMKKLNRATISCPPKRSALVVKQVYEDDSLWRDFHGDLEETRARFELCRERVLLMLNACSLGANSLEHVAGMSGMFAFFPVPRGIGEALQSPVDPSVARVFAPTTSVGDKEFMRLPITSIGREGDADSRKCFVEAFSVASDVIASS